MNKHISIIFIYITEVVFAINNDNVDASMIKNGNSAVSEDFLLNTGELEMRIKGDSISNERMRFFVPMKIKDSIKITISSTKAIFFEVNEIAGPIYPEKGKKTKTTEYFLEAYKNSVYFYNVLNDDTYRISIVIYVINFSFNLTINKIYTNENSNKNETVVKEYETNTKEYERFDDGDKTFFLNIIILIFIILIFIIFIIICILIIYRCIRNN